MAAQINVSSAVAVSRTTTKNAVLGGTIKILVMHSAPLIWSLMNIILDCFVNHGSFAKISAIVNR